MKVESCSSFLLIFTDFIHILKKRCFWSLCSITREQLQTMFVLALLTCIALRAFSAQAKVVKDFNECRKFFYNGKEPVGMDQNAKKICQKMQNMPFQYATLYSVSHRIPLYSAYKLDPGCSDTTGRKDIWHIEPQVPDCLTKVFKVIITVVIITL